MDRYDLQSDSNGLMIVNNDLVYDISDTQHVQDTLNAAPGWWKENISDGVDIRSFINSSQQEQILARKIKLQLESDLYTVTNPKVYYDAYGKITIEPNATI